MLIRRTLHLWGTARFTSACLVALGSLALFAAESRGGEGADAMVADGAPITLSVAELEARWRKHPNDLATALQLQDALQAAGERVKARKLFSAHYHRDRKNRIAAFLHGRAAGSTAGLRLMYDAVRSDFLGVPASQTHLRIALLRALAAPRDDDAPRRARTLAALAELTQQASAWHEAGEQWERAGQLEDAEKAYRLAVDHARPVERARHRLTLLLATTGRAAQAEALARATVAQFPTSSGAHLHLGLVQCMRGDVEEGRASYARAMERADNDPGALAALGAAYLEVEDFELARKALGRALRIDGNHVRTLMNLGILEIRLGQLPKAEALLARAARLDRNDARVAFLQGVVAEHQDKLAKAIGRYRRAHRLDGTNASYPTALAMALVRKGQPQQAIWALERAIKISPEDPGLRLQLGLVLIARRKWRAAEDALRTAARLDPKDATPWFHLAIVRGDHRRDRDGARRALEIYARLGGQEPVALTWLQELRSETK